MKLNHRYLVVSLLVFSSCSHSFGQLSNSKKDKKKSVVSSRNLSGVSVRDEVFISNQDSFHLYGESFSGFELMDSQVADYEVFITGENHMFTESNARIWLKMIKYLHRNAGVRNIMFEYGNSYGILVNDYLKTGDTSLFQSINRFAYKEYGSVIQELKEFNDSLADDEKLYFTGIDLDRGVYPIAKTLNFLLPDESKTVPDSIAMHIASIRSLASYNDFKLGEGESENYFAGFQFKTGSSLKLISENFESQESLYKEYLGNRYEEFRQIIVDEYQARQKWQELESTGAIQEYHFRENYMHQRFLSESSSHPGNWFGQFGRCHTTMDVQSSNSCEWFRFSSLADRIENSPGNSFKDKVMTIGIVYNTDRNFAPDKSETFDLFNPYFEDMEENSVSLIDLSKDSQLVKNFSNDFSLLLLNSYDKKGQAYTNSVSSSSNSKGYDTKYIFGIGSYSIDMTSLNDLMRDAGAKTLFDSQREIREFAMLNRSGNFISGFKIGSIVDEEVSVGSIATGFQDYELSGLMFKTVFFYNVTHKMKVIDLLSGIGFGYNQLELSTEQNANVTGNVANGFLGSNRTITYENDAFIFDGYLALDINLGRFVINATSGYTLDVSNKNWKSGDERIKGGPKTSFTGFFQTFGVGVAF